MLSGSINDTNGHYSALNDVVSYHDFKHVPPHTVAKKSTANQFIHFPTIINIMFFINLDLISRINLVKTAKCFRNDYKNFEISVYYKTALQNDQLFFQKEKERFDSELAKLQELRDQVVTKAKSKECCCRFGYKTVELKKQTLGETYCFFGCNGSGLGTLVGFVISLIPTYIGCSFYSCCTGSIIFGGTIATGCAIGTIGVCASLDCVRSEISQIVDLNKQEIIIKQEMKNNNRFYNLIVSRLPRTSLTSSTSSAVIPVIALPPPSLSPVGEHRAATADILAVPPPPTTPTPSRR